MIGRRAVIALSLLCALAFSAIVVTSAMAETKTTTAFTCVKKAKKGGAGFSKEHCSAADAVSSEAEFEHVEIPPGNWTVIDATNANTASETTATTNAVLTATVGGLKAIVTAKTVTKTGELKNTEDPVTHAMSVQYRHIIIHASQVTLSGALATVEGCKVEGEATNTNELQGESIVNTMEVEYRPEVGTQIVHIKLAGCKNAELNKNGISVTGTFKSISDGATTETTAASTVGLIAAGQKASYTSKGTLRMTKESTTENPISFTTITEI
jgi:hypothetical protein